MGAAAVAGSQLVASAETEKQAATGAKPAIVTPPLKNRILLSCKLGMIAKEVDGEKLTLTQRLSLAGEAGFDGVDFDEAGSFTAEEAREAVAASGVFAHNARYSHG